MKRREFLRNVMSASAAACVPMAAAGVRKSKSGKKPNIVLIYADDLGYGDIGYHGNKLIPTPHIDSIAREGARFTAGYVTAPICGPSRAGLLTGRYQNRFGFDDNPPLRRVEGDNAPGIPRSEKNLAERLKPLGYATAAIGKWHVGNEEQFLPLNRGFDAFFGFLNGALRYDVKGNDEEFLLRGTDLVDYEHEYLTDAFGREAVSFINRHHERPFFLYLAFNAVHAPLHAPDKYLDKFKHVKDIRRRKLIAMTHALDVNVGRVLEALRKHNLEEDTLVWFISDNGGMDWDNASYNDPFRGQKLMLYEGGVRTPFCMRWKGRVPAGRVVDDPVIALDVVATSVAAAGVSIQPAWNLDGVDLLPFLRGETKAPPHDFLYWRFRHKWAVRDAEWKLVREHNNKPAELYHLASDKEERFNLMDQYPGEAERLRLAYERWNAKNMEPQWGPFGPRMKIKKTSILK